MTVAVTVGRADASNAAMYTGLVVAVLIFIIVIIFVVCLLRRRVPHFIGQSSHRLTYLMSRRLHWQRDVVNLVVVL